MGGGGHAVRPGLVKVIEVNMFLSMRYREASLLLQSMVSGGVRAEALISGKRHAYIMHNVLVGGYFANTEIMVFALHFSWCFQ